MARRPDPAEFDRPLTSEQLAQRKRELSMLSPDSVAKAYREAHEACRIDGDRLPPRSIQKLDLLEFNTGCRIDEFAQTTGNIWLHWPEFGT